MALQAAPVSTAIDFDRNTGVVPNFVLSKEEQQDIVATPLLDEDGELAAVQLTIPVKPTETKNKNFQMLAAANDYNGGEPRMIFIGNDENGVFMIGDAPWQIMAKIDLGMICRTPKKKG